MILLDERLFIFDLFLIPSVAFKVSAVRAKVCSFHNTTEGGVVFFYIYFMSSNSFDEQVGLN